MKLTLALEKNGVSASYAYKCTAEFLNGKVANDRSREFDLTPTAKLFAEISGLPEEIAYARQKSSFTRKNA